MPVAEIVTIGTELLLGEIVDTNSRFLARRLRDAGIDLYRITTVGDNVERIAAVIQESLTRAEIVITTGGLGPTVDDPTREAVARATERPLVFRQDLWDDLLARYARLGRTPSENNKRQAYVPQGARVLPNPVGTAPSFAVETPRGVVISLPGVPREMETIFDGQVLPYLRQRFHLRSVILARVLHTAGVPESEIDERIADLEQMSNPTVGLAAHPAQVDIRITAKAEDEAQARAMIAEVEAEIRRRLGRAVYGADDETLEGVIAQALAERQGTLIVLEGGLRGVLLRRLAEAGPVVLGGQMRPDLHPDDLLPALLAYREQRGASHALGALLTPEEGRFHLTLAWLGQGESTTREVFFGGAPGLAVRWAVHVALDFARRRLHA